MRFERDVDCGVVYEQQRLAFLDRLRASTPAQLATTVPATPEWTVHDVLAHVVGITADLNAQEFGDGSADGWTAAQVDARRSRTIDELAAEWDREAPTFEEGLGLFGYELGCHYVGDLMQHVADVGGALRWGPLPEDEALFVALDHYLETCHLALEAAGAGGLAVTCAEQWWRLGNEPVVATVSAGPFALFRSLGGRRTADEIRALPWSGEVDRVLPHLAPYPLATRSLGEG